MLTYLFFIYSLLNVAYWTLPSLDHFCFQYYRGTRSWARWTRQCPWRASTMSRCCSSRVPYIEIACLSRSFKFVSSLELSIHCPVRRRRSVSSSASCSTPSATSRSTSRSSPLCSKRATRSARAPRLRVRSPPSTRRVLLCLLVTRLLMQLGVMLALKHFYLLRPLILRPPWFIIIRTLVHLDSGTLFLIPKLLEDVARTRDEVRSTTSRPIDAQYTQRGVPVASVAAHSAVQPATTSNADASSAPKKRSPKRPMAAPVLLDQQSGPPLETDSNRLGAAAPAFSNAARRPSLSVLELIDLLDEPAPPPPPQPSRTQPTRATAFAPVPTAASAPAQRAQAVPSLCRKTHRAGRLSRYKLPSALALRSDPATSRPRVSAYGYGSPLTSSRSPRGRDLVDGVGELFGGGADDEDDEDPESGRLLIDDSSIETRDIENCTDSFPLVTCPVDGIEPAECSSSLSCEHEDRCASCAEQQQQQQLLVDDLLAPSARAHLTSSCRNRREPGALSAVSLRPPNSSRFRGTSSGDALGWGQSPARPLLPLTWLLHSRLMVEFRNTNSDMFCKYCITCTVLILI